MGKAMGAAMVRQMIPSRAKKEKKKAKTTDNPATGGLSSKRRFRDGHRLRRRSAHDERETDEGPEPVNDRIHEQKYEKQDPDPCQHGHKTARAAFLWG